MEDPAYGHMTLVLCHVTGVDLHGTEPGLTLIFRLKEGPLSEKSQNEPR